LVSAAATAVVGIVHGKFGMGAVLLVAGGAWMTGVNTFSVASQNSFPNWVRARSSAIYLVDAKFRSTWGDRLGATDRPFPCTRCLGRGGRGEVCLARLTIRQNSENWGNSR